MTNAAKHRTLVWPGLIFVFLGLNIAICATTAYLANSDRSFKVVKDYDSKASSWDKDQTKIRAGEALGWRVQLTLRPHAEGACDLSVTLKDASDASLPNASITLEAFHHAFPNDIVKSKFASNENDEYATTIPVAREGRWTMELTVQQGDHVYTKSFLKDVYLPLANK